MTEPWYADGVVVARANRRRPRRPGRYPCCTATSALPLHFEAADTSRDGRRRPAGGAFSNLQEDCLATGSRTSPGHVSRSTRLVLKAIDLFTRDLATRKVPVETARVSDPFGPGDPKSRLWLPDRDQKREARIAPKSPDLYRRETTNVGDFSTTLYGIGSPARQLKGRPEISGGMRGVTPSGCREAPVRLLVVPTIIPTFDITKEIQFLGAPVVSDPNTIARMHLAGSDQIRQWLYQQTLD
jgi:hypothetical protein